MVFWIVAVAMVLGTTLVVVAPLLQARGARAKAASHDRRVYRDQMAEIDRDLARGVLNPEDADAAKAEIGRRLLAAADAEAAQAHAAPAPLGARRGALLFTALVAVVGTFGTYLALGAPGYQDQPLTARQDAQARAFSQRPDQAMAEAAFAASDDAPLAPQIPAETQELLDQLLTILEERTTDLRGHRLLADNLAQLGLWAEAHVAQRKVLELQGAQAPGRDFVNWAEYQILAAGGYVSPEAESALAVGLQRTPTDPKGRYYSGLLLAQAQRPDLAYDIWVRLLMESPEGAPWMGAIQAQLPQVAEAAGRMVPGALLPDSPVGAGPNAEQVAAAQEMSPVERQEMIQGMVAGLAERLATAGGPPEDWARLIRAYGVLGELRKASDIWNEAREVYADAPAALGLIRRAARDAEVVQ